jgi:formylglycine-generating enzyme required for sulfatase activity
MNDGKHKPSFWETLPGIITAAAAFVGACAALVTALYGAKIIGHDADKATTIKTESAVNAAVRQNQRAVAPGIAVQPARKIVPPPPKAPEKGDTMTDPTTGMKLVYVPKGCFQMGSPPNEEGRRDNEGPVHKVCVDGFWMGKYEVTQGQWREIMRGNPAKFQKGDDFPVEQVSWTDTQEFIAELNRKSNKTYRLPTEAEWEYACRADGSGKYCGGDNLDTLGWYYKNSGKSTHPVGKKQANDFGLYDMSGNVWEWCGDWYEKDYYKKSPLNNPPGSRSGKYRVLRGGSWSGDRDYARCSFRFRYYPNDRLNDVGFRVVFSLASDS